MTTQLKIYNGALTLCEAREIADLAVNEEGRRLLDSVWNDGGVRCCLEQAQWKFAMRAVQLDADPDFDPEFGFQYSFAQPSDFVALSAISADEHFYEPLTRFLDEGGFWYCDHSIVYVRYVSDHADFGGDMTLWPSTFTDFVKAYFASKICHKAPGSERVIDKICHPRTGELSKARTTAKNKDAMKGPTSFPVRGSWGRARAGGRTRRDGGGRSGNLIG